MNIELTDMLVFEDEAGYIYQDCICKITTWSKFEKTYECNDFRITTTNNEIDYIGANTIAKYKLKEIWHRTDENTYKKVWSK